MFQLVYWIKKNIILVATVSSVFLGSIIGLAGRLFNPSEETIILVAFPGEILMRMLNMIVLPMIASSIITGQWRLPVFSYGMVTSRVSSTCLALHGFVHCCVSDDTYNFNFETPNHVLTSICKASLYLSTVLIVTFLSLVYLPLQPWHSLRHTNVVT